MEVIAQRRGSPSRRSCSRTQERKLFVASDSGQINDILLNMSFRGTLFNFQTPGLREQQNKNICLKSMHEVSHIKQH